jgi:hypothetical protein
LKELIGKKSKADQDKKNKNQQLLLKTKFIDRDSSLEANLDHP